MNSRRGKSIGRLVALIAGLLLLTVVPSWGQQPAPSVRILGMSPETPPANSLAFRRALAYAIDREAISKAVAPTLPGRTVEPAVGIQHPRLQDYNPQVQGYSFDATKAKALLSESGWNTTIRIFVGPGTNRTLDAFYGALTSTMSSALGVPVMMQQVANFSTLVRSAGGGGVAVYSWAWVSDRSDFGYPSFALGLAQQYVSRDAEIKALVDSRNIKALEQMLLDKALVIPIYFY